MCTPSPRRALAFLSALLLWAGAPVRAQVPVDSAQRTQISREPISRGRYMVLTGHCNNCHTANYVQTQGRVAERDWLLGNPVGNKSAAGTTYGANLRLVAARLSEDQWVQYLKNLVARPPMPWWSVRDTSEEDLRAMYRYIRQLGPAGEPAPAFVPPDEAPKTPYVETVIHD